MIEASVSAVPRLFATFLILAALLAAPPALVAKSKKKPWLLRTALAVWLAGIVAVGKRRATPSAIWSGAWDLPR
ncbi:hypothetical protein ACFWAZ_23475 [Streptomyces collinus]|uniref:hypothetical protein n=1 Tax=Streptomyces collinus TaxID=42684 RepID=UPI003652643C